MTSVPPEPPAGSGPSATPPTPPPPPPAPPAPPASESGWTAPPPPAAPGAPGGSVSGGFTTAAVNPLDWGILGAGLLAFIFSFFSYYSYEPKGALKQQCEQRGGDCSAAHWSAWHGFFGWFAVLLVLVGAIVLAVHLFAPKITIPIPVRLTVLGAFTLALLFVLLALAVVPSYSALGISVPDNLVNKGHSFGYWLSLIVILVGAVLSFLRLRGTGNKLPWDKSA